MNGHNWTLSISLQRTGSEIGRKRSRFRFTVIQTLRSDDVYGQGLHQVDLWSRTAGSILKTLIVRGLFGA